MTIPSGRLSDTQIEASAKRPVMRITIALSQPPGSEIIDPGRADQVLKWTRSLRPGDAGFDDPEALKMDLRHLGFLDERGEMVDGAVEAGRVFLDDHWRAEPNYPVLWRHVQAQLGGIAPEPVEPDYTRYSKRLAVLLDDNVPNTDIADAVLAMAVDGIDVPTLPLFNADRRRVLRAWLPVSFQTALENTFNQRDINWYAPDGAAQGLRQLLRDQNYGLGEAEFDAWVAEHGSPGLTRQLTTMFGQRSKWQTLRDLGLLDEEGRWSEVGFQREQAMIRKLDASGITPSLERLRWELHRAHQPEAPIPLSWALLNDLLPAKAKNRAQRIASIALSGGLLGGPVEIEDTLTTDQLNTLRRTGAWIHGAATTAEWPALLWLGRMAAEDDLNWANWEQICSFIHDKSDRPPEPELVSDWLEGVVTFEGEGRFRTTPAKPFKGTTKTGRNDPCPCGSGKKHKKCCRR